MAGDVTPHRCNRTLKTRLTRLEAVERVGRLQGVELTPRPRVVPCSDCGAYHITRKR